MSAIVLTCERWLGSSGIGAEPRLSRRWPPRTLLEVTRDNSTWRKFRRQYPELGRWQKALFILCVLAILAGVTFAELGGEWAGGTLLVLGMAGGIYLDRWWNTNRGRGVE